VLSIACRNQLSEIGRAAGMIDGFGAEHELPADVLFKLNVSLDEVLTNIISYGYDDEDEHQIDIRVTLDREAIAVRVEDDGRAYNPLETPAPDLAADIDERPIGGLGVHIVRSMMDALEYRRENGRNVFTMRKRLSAGSSDTTPRPE
jgi:anti-sigma regulatory factor (Ser/Thr protein kinase)